MKHARPILFGGLLTVAAATAVSAVAAVGGDEQRDRRPSRGVFVAPGLAGTELIQLGSDRSHIGVRIKDVETSAQGGVAIDDVDTGGPADKAGVKAGDVVVEFDGERVRSARQLTRLVRETPPGRTVKMAVLRSGNRQTLDVTPSGDDDGRAFEPFVRGEIERGLREGMRAWPEALREFRWESFPGGLGRGRLGVSVETLGDQLADYFGAKGGGVLVSSVAADSPAAKAGIKAGDVITGVNGTAVRESAELMEEVAEASSGSQLKLDIVRDKKALTLTATIEERRPTRSGRVTRPA